MRVVPVSAQSVVKNTRQRQFFTNFRISKLAAIPHFCYLVNSNFHNALQKGGVK
jgi:hypothetical protein